jgi:hypothetical protein
VGNPVRGMVSHYFTEQPNLAWNLITSKKRKRRLPLFLAMRYFDINISNRRMENEKKND